MKKLKKSLPGFQEARYYSRKTIDYYPIVRTEWENLERDIKKIGVIWGQIFTLYTGI